MWLYNNCLYISIHCSFKLLIQNADLAVAPMTINYARESVIDFTKPFMNLGIGILFKLPKNMPVRLFSFMSPLAVDIWLYVLAAYVLVSSCMFIVARFSPYEWQNPHPCVSESDVMENQFSLGNRYAYLLNSVWNLIKYWICNCLLPYIDYVDNYCKRFCKSLCIFFYILILIYVLIFYMF